MVSKFDKNVEERTNKDGLQPFTDLWNRPYYFDGCKGRWCPNCLTDKQTDRPTGLAAPLAPEYFHFYSTRYIFVTWKYYFNIISSR